MARARDRLSEAWRDLHEAVYYAADATGCAQFLWFGDLQARRGDAAADIESLRCIRKAGRLVGEEELRYQRLYAEHTRLIREANDSISGDSGDSMERFIAAARELEVRIWQIVPDNALPSGMLTRIGSLTGEQHSFARKDRRGGVFLDATEKRG